MKRIEIAWPRGRVAADLADTQSSRALLAALPLEATASTWGNEVYFALPLELALEAGARQVVEPGSVCFWVQGSALALPFGPTPLSRGRECRLASAANVLGRIEARDWVALQSVCDGDRILLRALPVANAEAGPLTPAGDCVPA